MAWSDEPTETQIGALFNFIQWKLPRDEAVHAVKWLQENSTRRDVSYELKRVRELFTQRKLTKESCFESDIWEGYEYDGS